MPHAFSQEIVKLPGFATLFMKGPLSLIRKVAKEFLSDMKQRIHFLGKTREWLF